MKTSHTISLIAVLLIGVLAFYWYEYRPYVARKICHDSYSQYSDEEYVIKYKICLNGFGL